MKVTPIDEVNYGTYVWQMPDGKVVMDEDGNYLCIFANKGDVEKIKLLRDAAEHHGLEEGKPLFFSGHRPVSNEEFQNQKQRQDWGLIADEWDIPALEEDLKHKKDLGII